MASRHSHFNSEGQFIQAGSAVAAEVGHVQHPSVRIGVMFLVVSASGFQLRGMSCVWNVLESHEVLSGRALRDLATSWWLH